MRSTSESRWINLRLAMGILQSDPTEATPRDLELFRQRAIELRATLEIEQQIGAEAGGVVCRGGREAAELNHPRSER